MTSTDSSLRVRLALLILVLVGVCTFITQLQADPWLKKRQLETPETMATIAREPNTLSNWPPKVNEPFPNISLVDHTGAPFSIDSLRGKPTLIEIVAMTCAGCQGYSGGNRVGGYGGLPAQGGMKSIDEYFSEYSGGLKLHDGKFNFVQIIIYNLKLNPATPEDLVPWREHFELDRFPGSYVLTGGKPLANRDTFRMIPGFLLLDRDLVVHYDATGHSPRHNLYTELLPAVKKFL